MYNLLSCRVYYNYKVGILAVCSQQRLTFQFLYNIPNLTSLSINTSLPESVDSQ